MHVHVVRTYYPLEYLDAVGLTNLDQKFTAAHLYITLQNLITILGNPYYVTGQLAYRMGTFPYISAHRTKIIDFSVQLKYCNEIAEF